MIRKRSECRYFDSLEPQSFQTLDVIVLFLGHEIFFVFVCQKFIFLVLWPGTNIQFKKDKVIKIHNYPIDIVL